MKVKVKITRYANGMRTALFHRATTTSKKPHFDSSHKIQRTRNCSSLYESVTPKPKPQAHTHAQSQSRPSPKLAPTSTTNNTTTAYPRSRPKPFHPTTHLPHPRALQNPPHPTHTQILNLNRHDATQPRHSPTPLPHSLIMHLLRLGAL
jgi:hypothetical protein